MKKQKNIPQPYPIEPSLPMDQEQIVTDPMGSYTGIGQEPMEVPVQDADDL